MKKTILLLLIIAISFSGCAYHHDIVRVPDASLYNQTVVFNNVKHISLLRFCDYYNLDWDWDLVSEVIEIKSGNKKVVLRPRTNLAVVNGRAVQLEQMTQYKNGMAYLPIKSAIYISDKVFGLREKPLISKLTHQIKTVVIDPGHGGKDPGALGRYGTKEKTIVLDIAKRLKRKLESRGIKVYLTRSNDRFISLKKRPKIARDKNADLFISIHANASRTSRAKGFEVYYLSEATDDTARAMALAENAPLKFEEGEADNNEDLTSTDPTLWDLKITEQRRQSKELAYYVCNITSDALSMKNRGVKAARFVVLKGSEMPAILVEVGFLSNRREESKLKTSSFRDKLASSLAKSILSYKNEYEKTNGFSR